MLNVNNDGDGGDSDNDGDVVVMMMVVASTHTSESEQGNQCGVQIQKLFGSCFKGLLCVTTKHGTKAASGGEQTRCFQGTLTL